MRIDCNEIPIGISESRFELNKLKSGKLVRGIIDINEKMEPKRNYMIMSMNVFNLLEHHDHFEHLNLLGKKEMDSITLVGSISGLDCYIDLNMESNNILLYYNKQIARDIKLKSILDGNVVIDDEVEIEVIL